MSRLCFVWQEETSDYRGLTLTFSHLTSNSNSSSFIKPNNCLFTQTAVIRVLLLVVSLAVECLIAEEACVFQRLATWCAVQAALVPQSVLHAEQVPVPDELITPLTHTLSPHVWNKDKPLIYPGNFNTLSV